MADVSAAPASISTMLPRNGNCQFPVRSIKNPPTTGLMIAASAEPVFTMPLAVPENCGAMSITGTMRLNSGPQGAAARASNPLRRVRVPGAIRKVVLDN